MSEAMRLRAWKKGERVKKRVTTLNARQGAHTPKPKTLSSRVNGKGIIEPVEVYQVILELWKEYEREKERSVHEDRK